MSSRGRRGMQILNSMGNKEAKKENWTKEEILKLWPQAAGELRGFQQALERNAGITAAQLDMALHLAEAEFERIKNEKQ